MKTFYIFIFAFSLSCNPVQPALNALQSHKPEILRTVDGVAVSQSDIDLWKSETLAVYGNKLANENQDLASQNRVLQAWKRGMVNALLADRVEADLAIPDDKLLEAWIARVSAESNPPKQQSFSALSVYAKSQVDGHKTTTASRQKAVDSVADILRIKRAQLLKNPTQEMLTTIKKALDDELSPDVGIALRMNSSVLMKGTPNHPDYFYNPALANAIFELKEGDVPSVVGEGTTRMLVIVGPANQTAKPSSEEIAERAGRLAQGKEQGEKLVELFKEAYVPAIVKFHPKVISDETKPEE